MRDTLVGDHGSLVGGFNPFEKYSSKWESSPSKGVNKHFLKPPARTTSKKHVTI